MRLRESTNQVKCGAGSRETRKGDTLASTGTEKSREVSFIIGRLPERIGRLMHGFAWEGSCSTPHSMTGIDEEVVLLISTHALIFYLSIHFPTGTMRLFSTLVFIVST